jgi:Concanavalin A-like lectin/glucanases superfamily
MTVSLFFAVPFAAAAVVLALCFVGCDIVFSIDEVKSFSDYTPSILDEPTLSAYWRLGEPPGATTAVDLKAGHNGTYLSQVFPDDPPRHSAAAPGLLTLGQPGIVGGDTVPPDGARSTCIEVNGGFVSVDFDTAFNPAKTDGFTLEAWVLVGWSAADPAADRAVIVSFESAGGFKGFGLLASRANVWQALVGAGPTLTVADGPEVGFDRTSHLVLTYDGTDSTLRFFVNGEQSRAVVTDYVPSTQSRLFIGAGAPQLPEPRFPWVGKIQCIAVYTGALSREQIVTHYMHGNGMTT